MKKLLTVAFLMMAVNAFADSTVINGYQIYSSNTTQVYNASKFRTKTLIVNGMSSGTTFATYTGQNVVIKCGMTQAGPFQKCTTATGLTTDGIVTWSDAVTWIQVAFTRVTHNMKVLVLGNTY